jgi:nucleotidyltransferase/DNA polymerase involved in DNA repair
MARAYGVRSAMPGFLQVKLIFSDNYYLGYIGEKLCPQLVFVSGNYTKYSEVAKVYRQVFKQYDPKFYYVGVDEATLEISEFLQQRKKSVTLVGKAFGGDCDCRLPAWTPELANQYLDAKQEQVKCEKCGKDRIVWSYERTFGVDVSNVVEEIRFKVEQETGGLTCSAGRLINVYFN